MGPECGANSTSYHEGKAVYISEPGLYQLIFSSRLETADIFRTWIFEEVLPSIRNKGVYDLEAVKVELALKDKEHQEELKKAMEALSFCISHPKLSRTLNYIYILYGPHHMPKLHQSQHQSSCLHHAQFYAALRQL